MLLALTSVPAMAQLPASTTPQNRKVVLEEFTGIHCQYCPDGHKRANDLKAAKPAGSVVLVNIHTGGYATPGAGEPDYRTNEGATISNLPSMGITGYPTGSINRHVFTGKTAMAINRGEWSAYADSILAKPSYVNVAIQGTLDVQTRVLTVQTQEYFTAASPVTANNLTVMLLEDSIAGPQTSGNVWYPAMMNLDGTYTHNHMLRKVLNPAATGDAITSTMVPAGTVLNQTYTYTVPAQYVNNAAMLGRLELVAFVAQGSSEIITAAYGPITLTNFQNTRDASFLSGVTADNEVCAGTISSMVKLYNNGSQTITSATISSDVNGGTATNYAFTGSIKPLTYKLISVPQINFTPSASNTLNVKITAVNGSADQDATNNTVSKANIPLVTRKADSARVTMNFTQDQYGSESSWKVYNELTGAVIAQDGPFTDLSASGTLLHTKVFTVAPNTCYKLEVLDAFGDGINAGTGAGKYELKSNNVVVYSSTGVFTTSQTSRFKSGNFPTAVGNVANQVNGVALYPNPTKDKTAVSFSLATKSHVTIQLLDMTGRVVSTIADGNYAAGNQEVSVDTRELAAGLYHVRVATDGSTVTERLSVVK